MQYTPYVIKTMDFECIVGDDGKWCMRDAEVLEKKRTLGVNEFLFGIKQVRN